MPKVVDRLSDFERDFRILPLSLLAAVIGVLSAFVAYALIWLIAVITNLAYRGKYSVTFISPDQIHLAYWSILVPVIGGLIVGVMARYGSEKIRGHGIPEALEAILVGRSEMEPKVAVLKPLSSAVSIGTGGPFGAEGPIIMTGGAFGSLIAQLFRLSSAERKTLLVAGAHNVGRLMIVSREDETRFVGYLGRSKVLEAWLRSSTAETERAARRPRLFHFWHNGRRLRPPEAVGDHPPYESR